MSPTSLTFDRADEAEFLAAVPPDPELCPFCGSAGAHFVALPDPAGVELAECGSCHQLFDPDDPGCRIRRQIRWSHGVSGLSPSIYYGNILCVGRE